MRCIDGITADMLSDGPQRIRSEAGHREALRNLPGARTQRKSSRPASTVAVTGANATLDWVASPACDTIGRHTIISIASRRNKIT
jgi:hypothetical protein